MKKKLSLKEILRGRAVRLGIKEAFPAAGSGKELSAVNVRIINRIQLSLEKKNTPTIAIITPLVFSQLCVMREKLCRQMMDNLFKTNICFLVLSDSLSIPVFLKNYAANHDIPIAASKYDEHYVKSLLREVIREKFQETVLVHGVILEAEGNGILITGSSGIGKTTAALKSAANDYYWVADDIAVIKRNTKGALIAGGHKKINRYVHTETTGIIPVRNLLQPYRIKVNTKLVAIIKIAKKRIKDILIKKGEKTILGIKLACLDINIPCTRFFDENLLKISVRQLLKDNL